jgi:hypothetical protein
MSAPRENRDEIGEAWRFIALQWLAAMQAIAHRQEPRFTVHQLMNMTAMLEGIGILAAEEDEIGEAP